MDVNGVESAINVRNKKKVSYFSELIKINNEVGYFTTRLTGITNLYKKAIEISKILLLF